jgi:hypothetical protein
MGGGTIAVSEGSHIVLFLQYLGISFVKADLNTELYSSGIPYLQ